MISKARKTAGPSNLQQINFDRGEGRLENSRNSLIHSWFAGT